MFKTSESYLSKTSVSYENSAKLDKDSSKDVSNRNFSKEEELIDLNQKLPQASNGLNQPCQIVGGKLNFKSFQYYV